MGLASLFRKKTNYFRTTIEPQCAYCQYGSRGKSEDSSMILCDKKGPMKETDSCKKFCYSPLKRIPVKQLNIEGIDSASEMYVEINEEELAAKQAAAAKAEAAEKARAEKKAAEAKAQEEAAAKAKAEAEAKAKAEAEAKAKAEAEAKAKAEADAKAKAEAEAKAKAAAKPTPPPAPQGVNVLDEIAKAAEAAEHIAQKPVQPAQAPQAAPAQPAASPLDEIAKAANAGVPKPAAPAPAPAPAEAAKADVSAAISEFQKNSAAGIDDEFADLDDVEGADVVEVEEHEEVMKSKKSTLVAESAQHRGPVPNLPSASAFLRDGKKKSSSSSGAKRQAPPPPKAMMQTPPKKSEDKK